MNDLDKRYFANLEAFIENEKTEKEAKKRKELRDFFAAAALTGIVAHPSGAKSKDSETVVQAHARWAYEAADAMLKARWQP